MTEENIVTEGSDSKGARGFHLTVLIGLGIIGALSVRVLVQIDKTADKLEALQNQVVEMKGTFSTHTQRLDAVDYRLNSHDSKIDALQRRVWSIPERPVP